MDRKRLVWAAGLSVVGASVACGQDTAETGVEAAAARGDAAARSLYQPKGTDTRGLVYGSDDGNYSLKLGGLLQFRYSLGFRDRDTAGVGDDNYINTGFEIPRARIDLSGTVGTPDLGFKLSGDFEDGNAAGVDGAFTLKDAYVTYQLRGIQDGLTFIAGQFKVPVVTEEAMADENQLAIDRSATNEVFSVDRTQAVALMYRDDRFSIVGAFGDGASTANTPSNSAGEANWALTARADWKVMGGWDAFNDFSSRQASNRALRIGGGIHYQDGGNTATNTNDLDVLLYSADIWYESNGLTLFAAFIGSDIQLDGALVGSPSDLSLEDFGVVAQAGYRIRQDVEVYGRYDVAFMDEARFTGGTSDFNFVTAGANYYPIADSNAIKVSGEIAWSLNENANIRNIGDLAGAGTVNNTQTTGFLGQPEDNEIVLRLQLGVVF